MYSLKLKIISHKKLEDIFVEKLLKYKHVKKKNKKSQKKKDNLRFFIHHFNVKKRKRIFTVLKSPHVNKKFREHFIMSTHRYNMVIKHKKMKHLLYFHIKLKKMMAQGVSISSKIILN